MRILAIETSCDETAIAVLNVTGSKKSPVFQPLANIVSSQIAIHKQFGGVVPNLAKREHQKNLVPVLLTALKEAELYKKKSKTSLLENWELEEIFSHEPELLSIFLKAIPKIEIPKIDAIAVTHGPGLAPALWTGVNFAKALALLWKKPLVPVNHLAGHIYVNMIRGKTISFPALALIVSGGHTELILMKKHNTYQIVGETRDDAAGEAFDKVARLLKLGYPGGPVISALAEIAEKRGLKKSPTDAEHLRRSALGRSPRVSALWLPRPMLNSDDFDFSFSGLKTAVLYYLRDLKTPLNQRMKAEVSYEFQNAVTEVLVKKTIRAAKKYKVKTIILGGGVAANKNLREFLSKETARELPRTALLLPEIKETTDNALMIAAAAYFVSKKIGPERARSLSADPGLRLH